MTFVYHIETHRNPRQIEGLVRAIVNAAPDSLVVVDHDRKFESPDPRVLSRLGAELRLSDGGYGDMSHVERWLTTARWLQQQGIEYTFLTNLTGQDYPIRSVAEVQAELRKSHTDAFIQTFAVLDPAETNWGVARGRTRYQFRHRRFGRLQPWQQRVARPAQIVNVVQPWVRVTTSTCLALGRRRTGPWGDDLVLRGGSFFCTLARPAVEAVLRFAANRPDVAEFLADAIAPEEVYLQTALAWAFAEDPVSAGLVIENNCRRYFDFSASTFNHPRTFDHDDLPTVLASGADFARKFDEALHPGVLAAIDAQLAGDPAGPSKSRTLAV